MRRPRRHQRLKKLVQRPMRLADQQALQMSSPKSARRKDLKITPLDISKKLLRLKAGLPRSRGNSMMLIDGSATRRNSSTSDALRISSVPHARISEH